MGVDLTKPVNVRISGDETGGYRLHVEAPKWASLEEIAAYRQLFEAAPKMLALLHRLLDPAIIMEHADSAWEFRQANGEGGWHLEQAVRTLIAEIEGEKA